MHLFCTQEVVGLSPIIGFFILISHNFTESLYIYNMGKTIEDWLHEAVDAGYPNFAEYLADKADNTLPYQDLQFHIMDDGYIFIIKGGAKALYLSEDLWEITNCNQSPEEILGKEI